MAFPDLPSGAAAGDLFTSPSNGITYKFANGKWVAQYGAASAATSTPPTKQQIRPLVGDALIYADVAAARAALTAGQLSVGDIATLLDDGTGTQRTYQVSAAGDGSWDGATKVEMTAASAAEVILNAGPLTGAPPTGAKWGVDTTNKTLYYALSGAWVAMPTAQDVVHKAAAAASEAGKVNAYATVAGIGAAPSIIPNSIYSTFELDTGTLKSYVANPTATAWVPVTGLKSPTSQHDLGQATALALSPISGTQAHLEGGAGYSIAAANFADNYWASILNTTSAARNVTFSGFAGAFVRDGSTVTAATSPVVVPANAGYRAEVVVNGGNRYLNLLPIGTASVPRQRLNVSAGATILPDHDIIIVEGGNPNLTLPSIASLSDSQIEKRVKALGSDATVTVSGTDLVEVYGSIPPTFATSTTIPQAFSVTLVADTSQTPNKLWFIT